MNAVCVSHKRRELFLTVQRDLADDDDLWSFGTLNLRQDGGIRWHLVYLMLLRCRELKDSIRRIIRRCRDSIALTNNDNFLDSKNLALDYDYDPLLNSLGDDEWDKVDIIVDFLQEFYEMCQRLKGTASVSGFGSLWQTIVNL